MNRRHHKTLLALILLAATALTVPACGPNSQINFLGYSSCPNYDTTIRTVRVPIFQNETYRRRLEFQLTEAVIREIEARTPYKVVPANCPADTELLGRIVARNKNLTNFNPLGEIREAETYMSVEVVWTDLRLGQMGAVMPPPSPDQVLPPVLQPPPKAPKVLVQEMWSFRPELGESLTTAEKTMTERMARQIVNMMETPW